MSDQFRRHVSRAIDIWAWLGGTSLLLLVLLIGVGVFFRYVLNLPINGLRDLSQLLLLCCVSGAIPFAARSGSHVVVDLIRLPGGMSARQIIGSLVALMGSALLLILLVALSRQASCGFRCGLFTPDLAIPFWPMYLVLGVGFLLYMLQIIANAVASK